MLFVARLLGKEQYGRFALVQSTANTFIGVAALGLGITATKYVSQYKISDPLRAGRICRTLAFDSDVSSDLFSPEHISLLARSFVGADYAGRIRTGAVCIVFTALNGYQIGALAGSEAFGSIARISACAAVVNLLVTAALTHYFGLSGAVIALGVNAFILWCLYTFAVEKECQRWNCRLTLRDIFSEGRILLTMSAPASLSGMIGSVAIWLSTVSCCPQTTRRSRPTGAFQRRKQPSAYGNVSSGYSPTGDDAQAEFPLRSRACDSFSERAFKISRSRYGLHCCGYGPGLGGWKPATARSIRKGIC